MCRDESLTRVMTNIGWYTVYIFLLNRINKYIVYASVIFYPGHLKNTREFMDQVDQTKRWMKR